MLAASLKESLHDRASWGTGVDDAPALCTFMLASSISLMDEHHILCFLHRLHTRVIVSHASTHSRTRCDGTFPPWKFYCFATARRASPQRGVIFRMLYRNLAFKDLMVVPWSRPSSLRNSLPRVIDNGGPGYTCRSSPVYHHDLTTRNSVVICYRYLDTASELVLTTKKVESTLNKRRVGTGRGNGVGRNG